MRVSLEAEPGEFQKKGPELLQQLAKAAREDGAEKLADVLEKASSDALPDGEDFVHVFLQQSLDATRAQYSHHLTAMLEEIGEALDEAVGDVGLKKSVPDYTEGIRDEKQERQEELRAKLKKRGYNEADWAPGGILFGVSNEELQALVDLEKEAKP